MVTAFGDLFFQRPDGVWFLDSSLEGTLEKAAASQEELDRLLGSPDKQNHFLLAGFVERAVRVSMVLKADECYDFRIHPRLGGPVEFENVETRNFKVALYLRGQLHDQVRHLKPGEVISKVTLSEEKKRWWKW